MGLDGGRDPNSFFFKVLTLKLSQRLNKTTQRRSKATVLVSCFTEKENFPFCFFQETQDSSYLLTTQSSSF